MTRQLEALLRRTPGMSAREIAAALRRDGLLVHKRDLNPVLYHDARFQNDGGRVPRWRLAGAATASPFTRDEIARQRRNQRAQLDRRQRTVAALRTGEVVQSGTVDDEILQVRALLLSKGFDVTPPAVTPSDVSPRTARPSDRRAPAGDRSARAQRPPTPAAPVEPQGPLARPARWQLTLRPWQGEALHRWYDAGGVGVCEAVTGTGKTHLGLEAVAQWLTRGERATILVPSILLQRQWEQRIQQFVPHALIAKVGGVTLGDPHRADVVIAVVNSAVNRDLTSTGERMTLLVADEVHRYGGEGWAQALRSGYRYRLGLTATLERGGDDGVDGILLPYFGRVVHHYGYDRATTEGVVAPFDLVFLGVELTDDERFTYSDLSRKLGQARKRLIAAGANPATLNRELGRWRGVGGEVTQSVIAYESASRDRRRLLSDAQGKIDAVSLLSEAVGESHGSVIFTQSKEVAELAAEVLDEGGIPAAAVFSDGMTAAQRQELIDALADGTLDALAAPRILDEGVDIPEVDLGVVMGASSSRRQMIQRLGRIIRLKPDGRRARFVVLYVAETVEDPESGAREDFMTEVEFAADRITLFREWDEDTLDAIWSGTAPVWDRDVPPPAGEAAPLVVTEPPEPEASAPSIEAAPPAVRMPRTAPPHAMPPRRVRRPVPRPVRAPVTDPILLAPILTQIEETEALVVWLRYELGVDGRGS